METRAPVPLLGAILVEQGKVQPEMLQEALEVQRISSTGVRLGAILLQRGYVSEVDLQDALQAQRKMADEVVHLLSPPEERAAILLVSQDERIEVALRPTISWSLHNLVCVDRSVAAQRAQCIDVQAMLWDVPPPEGTSVREVQRWRQVCPGVPLVALVREQCPARAIEELLQAGADQMVVWPALEQQVTRALSLAVTRHRLEERLHAHQLHAGRMERILAFLEMLAQLLTTVPDAASMTTGLSSAIISLLEAEACLVNWDGEQAPVLAGPQAGQLEEGLPEGLARALNWCRRRGQPLLLDDLQRHPIWGGMCFYLPGLRVRSLLCAPLWAGEKAIGVIAVMNRLDGMAFALDDQRALCAVAGQAALALENVRLRGERITLAAGVPNRLQDRAALGGPQ